MSGLSTLTYYTYFLDAATPITGSLLMESGLLVAKLFGRAASTAEKAVLVPPATGRNLGVVIVVRALTLLGEREVLCVFHLCLIVLRA
ncbi:uncharacterized protein N7511_005198 [Penicillium nucicola]|uniref:uncharacterized protein n=1 Tax=Penicillium nucicola TaxID=1850975 RepID=UPI0025450D0D|nr:uncharacterized protein N7511_005198 [Penicillium nucicola]KAJ5761816.1 hypothetical protein N7511_005198 [Penicillium nucicola]